MFMLRCENRKIIAELGTVLRVKLTCCVRTQDEKKKQLFVGKQIKHFQTKGCFPVIRFLRCRRVYKRVKTHNL